MMGYPVEGLDYPRGALIAPHEPDIIKNPSQQDILFIGLFDRTNFLDILQNFTVFEPVDGRTIKKIPRYQQFRAVHKTIDRLKCGQTKQEKSGVILAHTGFREIPDDGISDYTHPPRLTAERL